MILISGATGKIGGELVRLLRDRDVPVRALVRSAEKAAPLEALGTQTVLGEFDDDDALAVALLGVDRFFVLAAPGPDMVRHHMNAIRAAREARVKHLVKLSALGAKAGSDIHVVDWHGQTDAEVERSGLRFTILRPGSFMQNLLGQAAAIREGQLVGGAGDGAVALVDARDIAAVAARVLADTDHEGKVYEITGPAALSYKDMAKHLATATRRKVKYVSLPPDEYARRLRQAGYPDWLASDLAALEAGWATGNAARVTDTVRQVTGREARTFAEFARDYFQNDGKQ